MTDIDKLHMELEDAMFMQKKAIDLYRDEVEELAKWAKAAKDGIDHRGFQAYEADAYTSMCYLHARKAREYMADFDRYGNDALNIQFKLDNAERKTND